MRRLSRYAMLVFGTLTAILFASMTNFADSNATEHTVVFRILNAAEVDADIIEKARVYVENIYRHSGIDTEWRVVTGSESIDSFPRTIELTIVLVTEAFAAAQAIRGSETGFALSNDGLGVRRAYVFTDRVKSKAFTISQKKKITLPDVTALILGNVIAHEAGHLLLPSNAHSLKGIMKPQLDLGTVDESFRGRLSFTEGQSQRLRTVLFTNR